VTDPAIDTTSPSGALRRTEKAQRMRLRFARGAEAAEIGHLDLARVWERVLSDAGIATSYSQGNRPHPRITLAAGLPVGVTSEGELLDVVLAEHLIPATLVERVRAHLPPGLTPIEVREVGMGLPSLPSSIRWADYEVDVPVGENGLPGKIDSFLAAESLPWEDTRGEKVRRYDLRALVLDLRVEGRSDGVLRLSMRLRCDAAGAGRPDQVVKALSLPEASRIHRTRLVLSEASPARDAWRRRGRFIG
jgi:radical SAM-linked protein